MSAPLASGEQVIRGAQVGSMIYSRAKLDMAGDWQTAFLIRETKDFVRGLGGAPVIELHTGHYADTAGEEQRAEFERIRHAVDYGKRIGLKATSDQALQQCPQTKNVVVVKRGDGQVNMTVGRDVQGGQAATVINIDGAVSKPVIAAIKASPIIYDAKLIKL